MLAQTADFLRINYLEINRASTQLQASSAGVDLTLRNVVVSLEF